MSGNPIEIWDLSGHEQHTRNTLHAREACRRPYLYVGNLPTLINERFLSELFSRAGQVRTTKIVKGGSLNDSARVNYGFVEYVRLASAQQALCLFQDYNLYGHKLRLNWAAQGAQTGEPVAQETMVPKSVAAKLQCFYYPSKASIAGPTSGILTQGEAMHPHAENSPSEAARQWLYVVFVGDLAPEINDAVLAKAFFVFRSMYDARVIWDLESHRSRGYGFVRFELEADAALSISSMTGQWLGSRAIRVRWATRRMEPRPNITTVPEFSQNTISAFYPPRVQSNGGVTEEIASIYVGNLPQETHWIDIVPFFQHFGTVYHAQIHGDRRYAFITLDSHENAACAIAHYAVHPLVIGGRVVKVGWARFGTQ